MKKIIKPRKLRVTNEAVIEVAENVQKSPAQFQNDFLITELKVREEQQSRCLHRKGGTIPLSKPEDLSEALERGNAVYFCLVRHQLPVGNWMIRCIRCGKEWFSENVFTGEPASPGWDEISKQPSDNTDSRAGLVFPMLNEQTRPKALLFVIQTLLARISQMESSARVVYTTAVEQLSGKNEIKSLKEENEHLYSRIEQMTRESKLKYRVSKFCKNIFRHINGTGENSGN